VERGALAEFEGAGTMSIRSIDNGAGLRDIAAMSTKTQQLQIRVTAAQKAALRARAEAAGMDVSSYVMARVLPREGEDFIDAVAALGRPHEGHFVWAALSDVLSKLTARDFAAAVLLAPGLAALGPFEANYLAAQVEHRATQLGVEPPVWARWVQPLDEPWFATSLKSLRIYLLAASPVAFRRRNLFVDSTVGQRV
jgi:hypothetical protein